MQPVAWYWRRLRAMSTAELGWRLNSRVRDVVDFALLGLRQRPPRLETVAAGNGAATGFFSQALGKAPAARNAVAGDGSVDGHATLLQRAEDVLAGRHSFLGLHFEAPAGKLDWNREYAVDRPTLLRYSGHIDYRDFRQVGDAKIVWELNRHSHLVVLAAAYRSSGDERFAQRVVADLRSWMRDCPYGRGMNWRSPLELAIRLINWVRAIEWIRGSEAASEAFLREILPVVHLHVWEVGRKYSQHSSANNHLVGEAAGVFCAATYFSTLKAAARWREESRAILLAEIERQTLDDGGHVERAVGYHLFVLEFFLLCGLMARNSGADFPPAYWSRLEKMLEFVAVLTEGGPLPMPGDCDDGYVLELGFGRLTPGDLLAVGAALFGRADFKRQVGRFTESGRALLGESGRTAFDGVAAEDSSQRLAPRALASSGYYLLQGGAGEKRISVLVDCGALGFGELAAHGHADALSFTLRIAGRDVLVDPGTYDYFSEPAWRDYFRSTRAHNTLVVDGAEQSQMLGPFLWGDRAKAHCLAWEPDANGGRLVASHDGYQRLPDPVTHRRSVTLEADRRTVTVHDELSASGQHVAALYLHFAPGVDVRDVGEGRFDVVDEAQRMCLTLDPCWQVRRYRGSLDPIAGWASDGYHSRKPCVTLVGHCAWNARLSSTLRVVMETTDISAGGVTNRAAEGRAQLASQTRPSLMVGRDSHDG